MVAVLVTGSRHLTDKHRDAVTLALAYAAARHDGRWPPTLIHGDAKGADTLAAEIAAEQGWKVIAMPADWDTHHKAAGPIRNQQMVDMHPDLVVAFLMPNSRGTRDCVERALKADIPVMDGWKWKPITTIP